MSTQTCRNGHPRTNANTTVTKAGFLRCLACRRVAAKRKPCTEPGCDAPAAHDDGYCALHHALAITAHKRRPAAADAEWWDRAACRGLDGLYDGLSSGDRRRLCDACPVQGQCRADGEQQDYLTRLGSMGDSPLYGGLHPRDLNRDAS